MKRSKPIVKKQLEISAIEDLRTCLRGELLLPNEDGYDSARTIWNATVDRKPAIIVRCLVTHDVVQAIKFAQEHSLLVAVKGGGHNVAGNAVCSDDGIMLDLSLMRSVYVDRKEKTVHVGPGCLLGDIDYETQLHGLAISGGIVSHTGVAGLTLGGGFGWISRKHGLAIDNLISAEVVCKDGTILTVSGDENTDLFWGLKGGGGNFCVVTSFKFKCAEIGPEVFSGLVIQRFEDAKAYMQFHAEYVRTLPDDMTVWMVVRHAPPLPFLDKSIHGKMVIAVPFVFLGDPEKGKKLIKPIREFGKPHGEHVGLTQWTAWQSGFDGLNEHGGRNYWKSHHLKELSGVCIDKIIEFASNMPSKECEIFVPHMEGVAGRVSEDETAYTHRRSPFILNIHTRWQNTSDDELCIAWARDFHEMTAPFASGVYVNFLSNEGEERVKQAYSATAWNRLVALKNKYDPQNLFRMNQNIKPS